MIGWMELLIGFLIGLFGTWLTQFWLYKRSVAPTVDRVAQATFEMREAVRAARLNDGLQCAAESCTENTTKGDALNETGALRNLYRYELGVILDDLVNAFDQPGAITFTPPYSGRLPLLADWDGDRWTRFKEYVAPVLDELRPFANLPLFPGMVYLVPSMTRLSALYRLCTAIRRAVAAVDAASDYSDKCIKPHYKCGHVEYYFLNPEWIGNKDEKATRFTKLVNDAHRDVYAAWVMWLHVIRLKDGVFHSSKYVDPAEDCVSPI